jgi:hypothetical protein
LDELRPFVVYWTPWKTNCGRSSFFRHPVGRFAAVRRLLDTLEDELRPFVVFQTLCWTIRGRVGSSGRSDLVPIQPATALLPMERGKPVTVIGNAAIRATFDDVCRPPQGRDARL